MLGNHFWSVRASRNWQNNAINCSFCHLLRLNTLLLLSLKLIFSSQNRYQRFSRRTACLGPCPYGKEGQKVSCPKGKSTCTCPGQGLLQAVNRAVSNVEGLKLKISAHKTFENKLDQTRARIKFIYCQNTSVISSVYMYSDSQTCNVWPPIRTCSFFHAAMQANVFSIEKTHQHILYWREILSFVSINDRN